MTVAPEIPEEAIKAASSALSRRWPDDWHSTDVWISTHPDAVSREVLAAALPHLQPSEAETKALAETAGHLGRSLGLEEAAKVADDLAAGVVNPEKLYNEAFIHACGCVARAIRELS